LQSGGASNIGEGIEQAAVELSSQFENIGRHRQIVLISDGYHDDNPTASVHWARFMGVRVHTVALKGLIGSGDINLFELVPENGGEFVWNTEMSKLIAILQSTSPHNKSVKRLDIHLADDTWLKDIKLDKNGFYMLPPQMLVEGHNNFVAHALSSDGLTSTKTLTLVGKVLSKGP
jgi:hypothetical protein